MRLYLEATEIVQIETGVEPEFIRADITGLTAPEVADAQAQMEAVMAGRAYRIYRHRCHHDETAACPDLELVKEVIL